jgi:soluble lytic murein transglycosylase
MRRYIIPGLILLGIAAAVGLYFFNQYWIHRYDELIARHARVYRLDEKLVWSVIYEETYFRAWIIGDAKEVGLMQITPTVAVEWAAETGLKNLKEQAENDVINLLRDPETNIQIGSWYLEKLRANYRDYPAEKAMTLAAYNAGASRVAEWTRGTDPAKLTREQFIERIAIPSTRAYVSSILKRYDEEKKSEN